MFGKPSEAATVRKVYKKFAPMMVQDAAKNNIKLDYSIDSIKLVDHILSALHKEYTELGDNISQDIEDGYKGYADMLGCYMLAVIDKNNVSGRLSVANDQYGVAYGFIWVNGDFSDFVSWCHKAIMNGKDDAVWPKFIFFSQAH
jgi:hypothetical protein